MRLFPGIYARPVQEEVVDPPVIEPGEFEDDVDFNSGLRRLHLSPTGAAPLDGKEVDLSFTSFASAFAALQPGDVLTIAAGTYRGPFSRSNFPGTTALPAMIAAETSGEVRLVDTWADAENGKANLWTSRGGGVFSSSHGGRPYFGYHEKSDGTFDFLFPYLTEQDLRASSITRTSSITNRSVTVTKPQYGFAWVNGTVFVRLRNGANPNGQRLFFSETFSRPVITLSNCDNMIFRGIVFEGGGSGRNLFTDAASTNLTFHNCKFSLSRHGARVAAGAQFINCYYYYRGFDGWVREVFELDGRSEYPHFVMVKNYYNGAAGGGGGITAGGAGNAWLEGGLEDQETTGQAGPPNLVVDNCVLGPCFDGSRLGVYIDSVVRNCVFFRCFDDGIQQEGPAGHTGQNNEVHDCKFIDCFRDISIQGEHNRGDFHVYRCLFLRADPAFRTEDNDSLKMITTDPGSNNFFYHCTWMMDYGSNQNGPNRVWTDFGGSNSDADKIKRFFNNIIIVPRGFSNGSGADPQNIERNCVVGGSAGQVEVLLRGGGVFAGTATSSMQLNADFSLKSGSPARGIGRSLPSGFPDSRSGSGANSDAGAFPFGETPGANWPRSLEETFQSGPPSRWTSPGA